MKRHLWMAVVCAGAAACQVAGDYPSTSALFPAFQGTPESESKIQGAKPAITPVLYGRDGKPAGETPAALAAGVELGSAANPTLLPGESGRMHILELYQKAIEERDALVTELSQLQRQVEQERLNVTAQQRKTAELESKLAVLEADRARVMDQNVDLAGRLTTAQIRRLQAEKLLLEHKIREAQQAAAGVQSAPIPAASVSKP